jgi:hypothetical protein
MRSSQKSQTKERAMIVDTDKRDIVVRILKDHQIDTLRYIFSRMQPLPDLKAVAEKIISALEK